ncbi:MAG: DUF521 domain-containing protein, partial [Acidimicrobiia bacterium]|nr:DUF521 domain-containing protein [Acidimicrobiia bacterium]
NGDAGEGTAMAMRLVVKVAEVMGATDLLDISSAHIDSCLYHGEVGLDFARRLRDGGARVKVRSTSNVSAIDLLHPDLVNGSEELLRGAAEMMQLYTDLGCEPTWSCAPYQGLHRPEFGAQVAWAESNAIVFANSVLGARTNRYGDFIDIAAAVTGRAPRAGLHLTEHRRGQIVYRLTDVPSRALELGLLFPVLGQLIGSTADLLIPVVDGIGQATEDDLKALGAAAASAGSVALIHVVGVTPEAGSMSEALHGQPPERTVEVTSELLRQTAMRLTTSSHDQLGAVSLGTPHYSIAQLTALAEAMGGRTAVVPTYVNTGREMLERTPASVLDALERSGVQVVADTCAYITPVIEKGPVMTDSGKAAYYLPGNLGVETVFGSFSECVESAVVGRVTRDAEAWNV